MNKLVVSLLSLFALIALIVAPASAAVVPPTTAIITNRQGGDAVLTVSRPYIADAFTSAVAISDYSACNIQYVTAVGTSNATTISLQFSNDGLNWVALGASGVTAANIITGATTAQNDFYPFNTPVARYMRANIDVTNANPVTVTLWGACR